MRQVRKSGGTAADLLEESQKAATVSGGMMSPNSKRVSGIRAKTMIKMGSSQRGGAGGNFGPKSGSKNTRSQKTLTDGTRTHVQASVSFF